MKTSDNLSYQSLPKYNYIGIISKINLNYQM